MKLTTGMRCSTLFHSCTSRAPKKLVASRPVTKTTTRVKMAPSPGMWTPSQLSVCSATGSSSSDWSSTSKMNFSTQIVMISGIQISSPVMKYFLTAPETKRPGSRRAGWLVGAYSVSGASRLLRLGFSFAFRLGFRFGLGFDLRCGLLFGRFLEVRGVPAGAFQLEAGRAEQLLKRRVATGRALGKPGLGGLLQELFLVATLLAAVFVDRHGQIPVGSDYIPDFGGKSRKSSSSLDHAELRGKRRKKNAYLLAPQQDEQCLRLLIAQQEFDLDREIAGQFEEVLLVQHAVATVAGNRAESRTAVNPCLLSRLEQPFVEQDAVVLAVLVHIEAEVGAFHDYLRTRRIEPMPAKVMRMEPATCAPISTTVQPNCWRPSSVAASPEKVENVVSPPRKPVVMSKRASGGSASKCDSTASAMPIR